MQKHFKNKKPAIAGAAFEQDPAIENCSVAQMPPQDVNESNRIEDVSWTIYVIF